MWTQIAVWRQRVGNTAAGDPIYETTLYLDGLPQRPDSGPGGNIDREIAPGVVVRVTSDGRIWIQTPDA